MNFKLRVKKSHIHGKGLFAAERIAKNAMLGYCKTKPTDEAGLHTLDLPDGECVDVVCKLKYINHSQKPNVVYYDDLSVVSLREIYEGEELTHDYGEAWLG